MSYYLYRIIDPVRIPDIGKLDKQNGKLLGKNFLKDLVFENTVSTIINW